MDEATKRSLMRENEAAETLAKNGYSIEQNPIIEGTTRKPDYIIENEIFDCYSPTQNTKTRNVDALIKQLQDYPIDNLEEVLIVKDGLVKSIYP